MITKTFSFFVARTITALALALTLKASGAPGQSAAEPHTASVPMDQTVVGNQYCGDGLSLSPTAAGARLRCDFQRLEGEATPEGLWLTYKLTDKTSERFRIKAWAIGRTSFQQVPATGTVSINGSRARLTCAPVVEEYSVSVDGVRQDFVVAERPAGAGEMVLQLDLVGAQVEATLSGANLVFVNSDRKIAYSRLKVTDASGRELTARLEVIRPTITLANGDAAPRLAVMVDDEGAVYPLRIDPTFSDANWLAMSGSHTPNDGVFAAVADDAGNLYISGNFTAIGYLPVYGLAKWDGNRWSTLGAGIDNGGVINAMLLAGTNLYLAGKFKIAGGGDNYVKVVKWDGTSFTVLDDPTWQPYTSVSSLVILGGDLYAGGSIWLEGGFEGVGIVKRDGSSWSVPGGGIAGSVHQLVTSGSDLIALTTTAAYPKEILKWDGNNWSTIVPAPYGANKLAVSGSDLYVAGDFNVTGGGPGNRIAKWDGTNWSAMGSGLNATAWDLTVSGGYLYVGGEFTTAGGTPANYIARWNGSSWSAVGSGMSLPVQMLAAVGSNVYAGGGFTTAGGIEAGRIAKWNGSSWIAPGGSGVAINDVRALAVSGSDLYAGGRITTGNPFATQVAKWNGTNWSGLAGGFSSVLGIPRVLALAVSGSTVYAGGYFSSMGALWVPGIARWNGSSWSALGSGVTFFGGDPGTVYALAISGSTVYAGGGFTMAGGIPAAAIARWNGSSWSTLGSGIPGTVFALAVSSNNVYAGGYFDSAGGTAATNIAKWNGSSWSALGSGVNGTVVALATSGNDLYVAGGFTMAGGVPALRIAKWDGSSWSALGAGVGDGNPEALAVSGSNVYAGGFVQTVGGVAVNSIAKWDGSSWSALGSGVSGSLVYALAASSSHLYVGGYIVKFAGGKVAQGVGRAVLGDAPGYNRITSKLSPEGAMQLSYVGYPATNYVLERAVNLATPDWIPQATNTVGVSGVTLFTNTPAPGTNNFWRIHSAP